MARKAKTKTKSKTKSWAGGVLAVDSPTVRHSAKPIAATIEKRADERMRLRLAKYLELASGSKLLVDGEYETALAIVQTVHPHNLIDVIVRGGLDHSAHRVHVRRSPL
jgi:hypothetical protein